MHLWDWQLRSRCHHRPRRRDFQTRFPFLLHFWDSRGRRFWGRYSVLEASSAALTYPSSAKVQRKSPRLKDGQAAYPIGLAARGVAASTIEEGALTSS
ncbi:hypothetical protein AMTR_s00060p00134330 [Amborella trichopoda]|uniref:Uncharacterized protein n=1 Tax=Amborella trichopoda TaxID=13333 RepID=W1NKV6_AMBTC|nr:hypothetical protein AMTR_s00060p00134330 [Amborella trichopoda]